MPKISIRFNFFLIITLINIMNSILLNPIFSAIVSGIFAVLLFYLDAKITKTKRTKVEYLKIFIISGLVTGLIIYISQMNIEITTDTPKNVISTPIITSGLPDF